MTMVDLQHEAEWCVIQGDCISAMNDLPPASIDLVLTDPPYGTTACKWDTVIPFEPMWKALRRIVKPDAAILLFSSQPFTSALIMSNPSVFKHEWVWIKNRGSNFANTGREPFKEHEIVAMFSWGRYVYNRQMQPRTGGGADRVRYKFTENSDTFTEHLGSKRIPRREIGAELRVPSSWQKFNTEVGLHPTQKPVDWLCYLIRTYSNEGDTVLDFTCGSGSAGVACLREGRRFIGIEQDDKYVEVARRRLETTSRGVIG